MTRHTSPVAVVDNLNRKLERAEILYRQFRAFAKRYKNLLQRYRTAKLKMEHFETKFLEKQQQCDQLQALVAKISAELDKETQEHEETKLCLEKLNKQFQSAKEVVLALDVEDENKLNLINTICSTKALYTHTIPDDLLDKHSETPFSQLQDTSTESMESSTSAGMSPEKPAQTSRKRVKLDPICHYDQESVQRDNITDAAAFRAPGAPFDGGREHQFTGGVSCHNGYSNDEEEFVFEKKIQQESSHVDASLKIALDKNVHSTTAATRFGTKLSSTPNLQATFGIPMARHSQSFDTHLEDTAMETDASTPIEEKGPATPINSSTVAMYRSNSASKLTNKQHKFARKYVGPLVKCAKCKRAMRFHEALQCTECNLSVHHKCHEQAPLPCIPSACIINKANKSSKEKSRLLEYCPVSGPRVPPLLINCFHELEKEHRIREIGLYRNSAQHSDIQLLVRRLLKSAQHDLSSYDTHLIAGVVKSFLLKLLSEPLVPTSVYSAFEKATEPARYGHSDNVLRSEIERLPQTNRDTLAYVMLHLSLVEQIPENKMDHESLTRVFAPTIVGYPLDAQINPALMDQNVTQRIMSRLLRIEPTFWDAIIQRAHRIMLQAPLKESSANSKKTMVFSSPKIS